ncbi:MAG: hypothetical protein H7067_02465 [Burkholderiales bacterium]|nr:hypothetical protein [Opitutaceae bacterium]
MDGQTLYFSVFATTTSATSGAWRLNLAGRGRNVFIENSATGWSLNEYSARPVASSATLALNTPTLLVVRVDFVAGAGDVFQLWVNPVLGATLGAPNATLTTAVDFSGLTGCSPRPAARGVETQCLSPPSPPPAFPDGAHSTRPV